MTLGVPRKEEETRGFGMEWKKLTGFLFVWLIVGFFSVNNVLFIKSQVTKLSQDQMTNVIRLRILDHV